EYKSFVLTEAKYIFLTYGNPLEAPIVSTAEHFLRETINYWRKWIKHSTIAPVYQEAVIRSALALKIHQYEDTGAIIAAGTTSLPEYDGSGRNWHYHYCWLLDIFYVLTALKQIGPFEEMEGYANYIANITYETAARFQTRYGL